MHIGSLSGPRWQQQTAGKHPAGKYQDMGTKHQSCSLRLDGSVAEYHNNTNPADILRPISNHPYTETMQMNHEAMSHGQDGSGRI